MNNNNSTTLVVVVPAKNEAGFIERSLISIINNLNNLADKIKRYVVVVDDASTDETPLIVQRFQKHYNFIKLIRLKSSREYDSSLGVTRTVHAAVKYLEIKHIKWDFLMQVDADTILLPHYIKNLLTVMTIHRDVGIAGGIIINEMRAPYSIPNTGMLIRREVWEECKGYRPVYAPDTLLQLCAIAKGWKIAVVKSARMYLMRSTKPRPYQVGIIDSITKTPIWYAFLRALKLGKKLHSIKTTVLYLAGYIKGAINRDAYKQLNDIIEFSRKKTRELKVARVKRYANSILSKVKMGKI